MIHFDPRNCLYSCTFEILIFKSVCNKVSYCKETNDALYKVNFISKGIKRCWCLNKDINPPYILESCPNVLRKESPASFSDLYCSGMSNCQEHVSML